MKEETVSIEKYREICDLLGRAEEAIRELSSVKMKRFNEDECWIWDMEGENYLDSLVCPIVILPAHFKALMLNLVDVVTEDAHLGFYSTKKRLELIDKLVSMRNYDD